EGVRDRHERAQEVSGSEEQQRAQPQDRELPEEQDRGDEVVDDQGRLVDREEGPGRREPLARERRGGGENRERGDDHDERQSPLPRLGGHRRQKYRALFFR